MALLTGVAPGFVDGVIAPTTPIGLANLTMPALVIAFNFADRLHPQQVAQGTERLALLLDDLVGDVAKTRVGDRKLGELRACSGL